MTDLDELVRTRHADVYKVGTLAASLTRLDHQVEFEYARRYLESGRDPVATTLPLSSQPVVTVGGAVPPFFAGLLPEGRRLSAIRRAVKTSADDDFTLLLAIGGETVGDVQVVPRNVPLPTFDRPEPTAWDQLDFNDLFNRSIGSSPELVGLPGVQEKLSGQMISFPTGAGRSILKLNPPDFPHIVENEAFFLRTARAMGLDAAEAVVVHDKAGLPGLLVSRFDRRVVDGVIQPVAQEDGTQVLGRYPADKYSVSLPEVVNGLAAVTRAPQVAAYELARQVLFAYLTGNGDQHAKNLSVYYSDSEWRVTPIYDAPSTYFYGDHSLALPIDEAGRTRDVSRRAFLEFTDSINVSTRAAIKMIDSQLEASQLWLTNLVSLPFDRGALHDFSRFVANRRRLLAP